MIRKLFVIFICTFSACHTHTALNFTERYTPNSYQKTAHQYGITNEKWIDRLYDHEVHIEQYPAFKKKGVDLQEFYGRDYKSRVLMSDVILEGNIISKKEIPNSQVLFHTEYAVEVVEVLKNKQAVLSDTILLKVTYGPLGNGRSMASVAGTDTYAVGERAILYLESMERTYTSYETRAPEQLSRINADRNNPNIFQPLKKYLIKNEYLYERTNGQVEKKKQVIKDIRAIVRLNNSQ